MENNKVICAVALDIATRQKVRPNKTSVDRALILARQTEPEVSRSDIIRSFKMLENDGWGKFCKGSRGYRSRMLWTVRDFSAMHERYEDNQKAS